ncbi:hypothetical protein GCM10010435_33590 [Winogradskya consettensis]|uniref:Uncharacterized protein n=1 Tax=Winogradskya consettensis TaxID=113560 RepID=A0A919SE45_9ACTN|nr:hypothetical protein Aco04nite_17900 [Actinoplanes consettensis]
MLRDRVAGVSHGVVGVLRGGLAMVPVSDALFEELAGSWRGGPFFEQMPPAFDRALAGWSVHGPLAFVQASFHGGDGEQLAAVWRDGALAWGPVFDGGFDGPREQWPINAALAQLGLKQSGRAYSWNPDLPVDLFDEVGFGLERDMTDWLARARNGLVPPSLEALARERQRHDVERALARIRPDLDGRAIMTLLDIAPGPHVGAATRRLRELSLERGPLPRAEAEAELRAWAHEQGIG